MLDSRPRGHGLEPHQHHCVVSLNKSINPSLVLVQPRMTCTDITEKFVDWDVKNQTNKLVNIFFKKRCNSSSEGQFGLIKQRRP